MTFKSLCLDLIEKWKGFKLKKSIKFTENELYPLISLVGVVCYSMDGLNVSNSIGVDKSEIHSLMNKINKLDSVENFYLKDSEIKILIKCINLVLEDTEEDEFRTLTGIKKIEMTQLQNKLSKILEKNE